MNSKNIQPALSIGCAILTYQAQNHLIHCLSPLLNSPLAPRILVVDSSSEDGTAELARSLGVEVLIIPKDEFNHGTTRELARQKLATDIVCMLTQDAYLSDNHALAHLVAPILENKAKISYARQIPHQNASFFEAFPRHYNYPEISQLRSLQDCPHYGVYTFFCSDSCAAYSNAALDDIGGFSEVLLGEDTVATAKILRQGHKIAYVAEALVYHSHKYSLWEEFCRSFDTGLARKSYAPLLECGSTDNKRGVSYLKAMLTQLLQDAPFLIPYALLHATVKWVGYQIGKASLRTPTFFKRILSSQKFYWK